MSSVQGQLEVFGRFWQEGVTGVAETEVTGSTVIEVHGSAALSREVSGMRRKSLTETQAGKRDRNSGSRGTAFQHAVLRGPASAINTSIKARKSTRLHSSPIQKPRMPSSA